ncbi:hypothetical protein [Sandaracinobacteroides hominis]|uniref:hypothetical protein n=1 Tax=Sandaracinobacteroides hominis TaxID=2780086 RepID=UPI0018F39600|nr:hypothetical protein [Sandaracinobacteroides hominis]
MHSPRFTTQMLRQGEGTALATGSGMSPIWRFPAALNRGAAARSPKIGWTSSFCQEYRKPAAEPRPPGRNQGKDLA